MPPRRSFSIMLTPGPVTPRPSPCLGSSEWRLYLHVKPTASSRTTQPSGRILMMPFHPLPPSPTFSPSWNQPKDLQEDNVCGRLIPASLCVADIIHSLVWSHMCFSCFRQSNRCQNELAEVGSDNNASSVSSIFYSTHSRRTLSPPKASPIMSLFGGTWSTGRVISSVEPESRTSLGLRVYVLFTKVWPA